MTLTPHQQNAATAKGNIAVTAGAGTGKTHTLVERYLFHIQQHQLTPLQIVAVTFTDKAAAELRSRIRAAIAAKLPDRFDILAEIEAAQISTLHALATRICRQHPEAANIPPDFTILDEIEGTIWASDRLEEAIASLPPSLYEKIPYSLLSSTLPILLKDPYSAELAFQVGTQNWANLAETLQQQALAELLKNPLLSEIRTTLLKYQGETGDLREKARQQALQYLQELESGKNVKFIIENLDNISLRGGSVKKWKNGGFEEIKEAIATLKDKFIKPALKNNLLNLEATAADDRLAAILPSFRQAFQLTQNFLTEAKRRARILDFADLEISALRALQNPTIQAYYRDRQKAFLVDEFQDTNPIQGKLLELLTSDAIITLVGDSKQSIYGFRRADVQLFQTWRDRLLATGGEEVILDTSFRTHQTLVTNINQIFAPLLENLHQNLRSHRLEAPHSSPHVQCFVVQTEGDWGLGTGDWEKKFPIPKSQSPNPNPQIPESRQNPLNPQIPESRQNPLNPQIPESRQNPKNPKSQQTLKPQKQRVEALHIAKTLKTLLDDKTPIYDKTLNKLRPLQPGDIAILSRTWEPLEIYSEAIASLGIPIAPAGGGNLLDVREAKDIIALLRFLADPADDIALVAVLRSPFFAVSDRLLFQIAQTLPKNTSWWHHLKQLNLPECDRPLTTLKQLLAERAISPPTRLLQLADRLTGYTAAIANLPGAARREADWRGCWQFVRQLEQGSHDIFAVARRLRRLIAADVAVPRLPLQGQDAVVFMTVHAAKGLEWPIVVLTDLTRSRPATPDKAYFDPEIGVALNLKDLDGISENPIIYICLEQMKKQREAAEELRVLYVGLTRARDRLILTAVEDRGGSFDRLKPGLEAAQIPIEFIAYNPEDAIPPTQPEPALLPEPALILLDSLGSGLSELPVTALSVYARCPKQFEWQFIQGHPGMGIGVGSAQRVGTLVHKALELGIREVAALAQFNLTQFPEEVNEAIALAKNYDIAPQFAPIRQAVIDAEKQVSLKIGNLRFNGIVDLLSNEWVLDFKSDREIAPEHHRFQLWAYAKAAKRKIAHIAYLRHDYLHTFSSGELEAIAPEAEQLVRGIVRENYPAQPLRDRCNFCPYAEICESRYLEISEEEDIPF